MRLRARVCTAGGPFAKKKTGNAFSGGVVAGIPLPNGLGTYVPLSSKLGTYIPLSSELGTFIPLSSEVGTYDNQGQNLVLTFRRESLKPFGEVSRGEKMLSSGTDPESYIPEYT